MIASAPIGTPTCRPGRTRRLVLSIALGCVALALFTACVAVRPLRMRVREMKAKRSHPQQISTSHEAAARGLSVQGSEGYRFPIDVTVLFYALCALLLATDIAAGFLAAGVWLYVLLRTMRHLIHCTYDHVMDYCMVFGTSSVVLAVPRARFAWRVAQSN